MASYKEKNIMLGLYALSFILNGYASGVKGISLGSVVSLFIIIYCSFSISRIGHVWNSRALVLILSFFLITLFDLGFKVHNMPNGLDILIGTSKYIIWGLFISLCATRYFDRFIFLKWMSRIGVVLTLYLIVQNVMYYGFSTYLPNIYSIGPLKPYDDGYADYSHFQNGIILRPASFLSESSFYGNYILCTLAMLLDKLNRQYATKDLYLALFFTFGVILSTSTSAITMLPLVWLLLGRNVFIHNKIISAALVIFTVIGVVGLVDDFYSLERSSDSTDYAIFYTFDKFNNLESSSRFGLSYYFLSLIPEELKYTGVGIGNEYQFLRTLIIQDTYYLNSVSLLIVQVGYLGFFLFILYLLSLLLSALKKNEVIVYTLLTIYFIKGVGSGLYFSTYGVLFMFIITGYLYTSKSHERQRSK